MQGNDDGEAVNEKIAERYQEASNLVMQIMQTVATTDNITYVDVARYTQKSLLTAALLVLTLKENDLDDDIDGVLAGFAYEEILQNPSPLSMVREQRRLQ